MPSYSPFWVKTSVSSSIEKISLPTAIKSMKIPCLNQKTSKSLTIPCSKSKESESAPPGPPNRSELGQKNCRQVTKLQLHRPVIENIFYKASTSPKTIPSNSPGLPLFFALSHILSQQLIQLCHGFHRIHLHPQFCGMRIPRGVPSHMLTHLPHTEIFSFKLQL